MKPLRLLLLLVSFQVAAQPGLREELSLYYFQTDHRYDYRTELLEHALSYSNDQPGEVNIKLVAKSDVPTARAQLQLKKGEFLGVVSLAVNKQREQDFLAIRIPILAGALGMRVLLIHEDMQAVMNQVRSIEDLQQLRAGFVQHWGDISILKYNGLPVVSAARYLPLFPMLMAKRFDYFPRGVNEIQNELSEYQVRYSKLAIEKNLAIYYPYPVYFFVNKQQTLLAERIEFGLLAALKDGSFKKLFLKHHSHLVDELNLNQRRILRLHNPNLPSGTKAPDMSWWLNSASLLQP